MSNIITLITLLSITISLAKANCQLRNQIADLWSETVTFTIPTIENNTMTYSFQSYTLPTPRSYDSKTNLQFAFSIKDFTVSTSNLIYFDLLVIKTFQSSLVLNFIYEPNKWQKITYNYWISFRKDMIMLIETYTDKQFKQKKQVYEVASSIDIPQQKEKTKLVVMAFLVGVRYKRQEGKNNHRLSFALLQQKVEKNNVKIQFQTQSELSVQALSLSFLVYRPSQASFGSYGGTIVKHDLEGSSSQNIHYLFPNHHYYAIYGLSAIQACNKTEESITYSSSLSPYFDFSISVEQWEKLNYIQVSYIISGNMPSTLCQKVPECIVQNKTYIYGHECVNSCPNGSMAVRYIDGAIQCQNCPQNQQFDPKYGKCQCKEGFKLGKTNKCQQIITPAVTFAKKDIQDTLSDSTPKMTENCLTLNNIQQGNKNIFVTLKASALVTRDRRSSESGFVRMSFSQGTGASSYYCNQCREDNTIYECLILFASGVPASLFTMTFQCLMSSGQRKCSLSVPYKSIKAPLR